MHPPSAFRTIRNLRRTSWKNGGPVSPSKRSSYVEVTDEKHFVDDATSATTHTSVRQEEAPQSTTKFQVKRLECYHVAWPGSGSWVYRSMRMKKFSISELMCSGTVSKLPKSDSWKNHALVFVRVVPVDLHLEPVFKYIINNPYVKTVCQDVIRSSPGIDWEAEQLQISPTVFIKYHQRFCTYRDALQLRSADKRTSVENNLLLAVSLIIDSVSQDFAEIFKELNRLVSQREITFNLLWAFFVPGSLVVAPCATTQLPRLLSLTSVKFAESKCILHCESVDKVDDPASPGEYKIGKVTTTIHLPQFKDVVPITELAAYPIGFHPTEVKLREQIIQRGRKWLNLIGVHHMQYNGPAVIRSRGVPLTRHVNSRIVIDGEGFCRSNPGYLLDLPSRKSDTIDDKKAYTIHCANDTYKRYQSSHTGDHKPEVTEEELLLTPAIVYGFSLFDKSWFEFNIDLVKEIQWNDDPFKSLVIPLEQKALLQSVVNAHDVANSRAQEEQGLVVNLSGPPGVGKSSTVEAISVYSSKPLYTVGPGDLGTSPESLQRNLNRIFDLATRWGAIVFIDEADIFIEKRTHHNLNLGALVATFLRLVDCYRGILFLTTSNVSAFDEGALSRIHVAIRCNELSEKTREQLWSGFINKIRTGVEVDVTTNQIQEVSKRRCNGRQIQSAVRAAQLVALAMSQKVKYADFVEALDRMEEFTKGSDKFQVAPVVRHGYTYVYGL